MACDLQLVRTLDVHPQELVIAQIRDLLVEEMSEQALWQCIFPEPSFRKKIAPWLFQRRSQLLLDSSYVLLEADAQQDPARTRMLKEGEKIVGHVAVVAPGTGSGSPSLFKLLSLGMWQWPFLFGLQSLRTFLAFMDDWERMEHQSFGEQARTQWGIEAVAIRRDRQRGGLGTHLMRLAMALVPPGQRVGLATQVESTMAWYQKLGFKVVADPDVQLNGGSCKSWFMVTETPA